MEDGEERGGDDGNAAGRAASLADDADRTQIQLPEGNETNRTQLLPDNTHEVDDGASEEMVRAIIEEINEFRRNPRKYSRDMKRLASCYDGKLLTYPDSGVEFETVEGSPALEDCLQDLQSASPLPSMTVSQALSRACQLHLQDLKVNDFCSHIGTDGSTPEERLTRFGEHREQCGENVVFGMRTAKEIVWHMLIDDGSPERGHRANLLNMDFHFVGVAYGGHPSAETASVVLLVDHFHVKQVGVLERMRNVTEAVLERTLPDQHNVPRDKTTQRAWDRLMQDVKPDHLAVPGRLLDHVHRNARPHVYRDKILPVPKYPVGELAMKPAIDPAIVRAFVHRTDRDRDDCIVEGELQELCHNHQLNVTPADIADCFDEIVMRRAWHDRSRRSVDWQEIFLAMKAKKEWVPAVDLHVECENDRYQLTVSVEELAAWCNQAYAELKDFGEGLVRPPSMDLSSKDAPRNRGGAKRIRELNEFLESIVATTDLETGERLSCRPVVQKLLGRPGRQQDIVSVSVMSQRRLWAHVLRPFRRLWVLLHQTVGLNPLVQLPVHKPPAALVEQPLEKHIADVVADQQRRNVAKPTATYTGVPPAVAKMRTSELPPRVQVRPPAAGDGGSAALASDTPGEPRMTAIGQDASLAHPWEEQRRQVESTVNNALSGGANGQLSSANVTAGSDAFSVPAAQMAYTFEARRRFKQMCDKQHLSSEEQRYLGAERTAARSMGSASTGRLSATTIGGHQRIPLHTAGGLGPANGEHRSHGAGAFSRAAPSGVRGHFHNSLAVHQKDGSHGWPQSCPVNWEGAGIDHARGPPQKNVENFGQPAGYAYMSKEERAKQFTTYLKNKSLGSGAVDGTHDILAAKAKAAASMVSDRDQHTDWKKPEFREDNPRRLGKFGRRDFDPQVRELPSKNPHNVSQIEDKPMEEYFRQQERVDDFLNRALPPGQKKHFVHYQPRCEQPKRHEEMASRNPVHCTMDGDQKMPSMGFGQNRHSDHQRDYRLYTRPLGGSDMDRLLPIA